MDIVVLKTFLEISRTHHFGKAAENLHVTQSTVSARIKLLEEAIGAQVFTRTRNDIQLTVVGKRLVRYAENIIVTWNRARQEIAVEDEATILLTVAGMPSLWDIVLQEWLNTTHQTHPNLSITAEVTGIETMQRRLSDGTLDLAFMFDAPALKDMNVKEIQTIPIVMVSSAANIGVEEALRNKYILVDWGTTFDVSHAKYFPDMPAPSMRVGLGRVALDVMLTCGGSAYMAEAMVLEYLNNGTLHLVQDAPVITRSAYCAYPDSREKEPVIKDVLQNFNKTR